jgi:acyl-coenzyme A synthetase/AMP-(fatty) acid ligase
VSGIVFDPARSGTAADLAAELAPGYQPDTQTALSVLDHAWAELARFKVPAYLEFVESFPMTPSARVEKRTLLDPRRDQRKGVFDAAANAWA